MRRTANAASMVFIHNNIPQRLFTFSGHTSQSRRPREITQESSRPPFNMMRENIADNQRVDPPPHIGGDLSVFPVLSGGSLSSSSSSNSYNNDGRFKRPLNKKRERVDSSGRYVGGDLRGPPACFIPVSSGDL